MKLGSVLGSVTRMEFSARRILVNSNKIAMSNAIVEPHILVKNSVVGTYDLKSFIVCLIITEG
ncbi:MAG: hypothetical protein DRJ49_07895 [Thermoprotei archaeon]|nr:MAG: hypothetical protein DRJ49_07895 [Thermoprotei archaeon]